MYRWVRQQYNSSSSGLAFLGSTLVGGPNVGVERCGGYVSSHCSLTVDFYHRFLDTDLAILIHGDENQLDISPGD